MKKLLLVVLFSLFFAGSAFGYEIRFAWNANTEPDLAGYKLYWGTTSGNYTQSIDLGPIQPESDGDVRYVTSQEFTLGTVLFFAVTAYDNEEPSLESGYSNEVFADGVSGLPPISPTLGIEQIIIINININ